MITNSITHRLAAVSPYIFRVGDVISVFTSALLAQFIRFGNFQLLDTFYLVVLPSIFLILTVTNYNNVYTSLRGQYGFRRAAQIIVSWAVAGAILVAYIVFTQLAVVTSRLWLGTWWLLLLVFMFWGRASVYIIMAYLRSKGVDTKTVHIVGRAKDAEMVKSKLAFNRWSGLEVKELFNINKDDLALLEYSVLKADADEVWICLPLTKSNKLHDVMGRLQNICRSIRFVPNVEDLRLLNHDVHQVAGINMITLSAGPMSGLNAFIKRVEDFLLGLFFLAVSSPVMLAVAIGVKLSSKGPVFFKQLRHGADGREIYVYKFRSMKIHEEVQGQVTQAVKADPRVTKFGAFIRRTSLDELPQFWNVVRGDMSIVGPRPHALAHNEQYKGQVESYMARHKVKPGITGWAQVNGLRGETDTLDKMKKRVEFDLYYIDNWSLWFDLKIIVMTFFTGFVNKNAY